MGELWFPNNRIDEWLREGMGTARRRIRRWPYVRYSRTAMVRISQEDVVAERYCVAMWKEPVAYRLVMVPDGCQTT